MNIRIEKPAGAAMPEFLRYVLLADAATCLGMGLLHTLLGGAVTNSTGIPSGLVLASGLLLFPIAAFIARTSSRAPVAVGAVWLVILGNLGWTLASVALLADSGLGANSFGRLYIVGQAMGVLLLTGLQYIGLRRAR